MGHYCSYLMTKQTGGTPQILSFTILQTIGRPTLYITAHTIRITNENCINSNCNETYWNGELTVKDNVTGVRRVISNAHVRATDFMRPLEIGTIRALRVGIEADCCQKGVTLR